MKLGVPVIRSVVVSWCPGRVLVASGPCIAHNWAVVSWSVSRSCPGLVKLGCLGLCPGRVAVLRSSVFQSLSQSVCGPVSWAPVLRSTICCRCLRFRSGVRCTQEANAHTVLKFVALQEYWLSLMFKFPFLRQSTLNPKF